MEKPKELTNTEHASAVIDNLISTALEASEILHKLAFYTLSLKLEHEAKALKYWRDRGGLVPVKNEWEE